MSPQLRQMTRLTEGLPTKSAKIRRLAEAGFARADIARFLDIRYQHVRKVLVDEKARQEKATVADISGGAEGKPELRPTKVRLGPDGRVVIPAAFREALRLSDGDTLIASVENDELHLLTIRAAVRRAQAIVRKFVPAGVSLVDELLEDRRREVERERQDD